METFELERHSDDDKHTGSHGRPQGGETPFPPMEIWTKSQKFLENLKSAAYLRSFHSRPT